MKTLQKWMVATLISVCTTTAIAQTSEVIHTTRGCPSSSEAGIWRVRNESSNPIRGRIEATSLEITASSNGCVWPAYHFSGDNADFMKPLFLNDQGYFLRRAGDTHHGMIWNSEIDGTEFRAWNAFRWIKSSANEEKMRLTGEGNLAIGITGTDQRLDVNGRMRIRGVVNNHHLSAGTWLHNGSLDKFFMGMRDNNHAGFYGVASLKWGLVYNGSNGNVGIGLDNSSEPSARLEVNGNGKFSGQLLAIQTPTNTSAIASLKLLNGHDATGDKWYIGFGAGNNAAASNDKVRLQTETTPNGAIFSIHSGNMMITEKLRITDQGNVGIGTVNPTELLTVNGNVKCTSLVTDAGSFPDYVFQEGYPLKSLEEVKAFIDKNKRLPGMPSEKEVVSKGLNVNQVLLISVEKIEELYQHIIELNKKVKELETKVASK